VNFQLAGEIGEVGLGDGGVGVEGVELIFERPEVVTVNGGEAGGGGVGIEGIGRGGESLGGSVFDEGGAGGGRRGKVEGVADDGGGGGGRPGEGERCGGGIGWEFFDAADDLADDEGREVQLAQADASDAAFGGGAIEVEVGFAVGVDLAAGERGEVLAGGWRRG